MIRLLVLIAGVTLLIPTAAAAASVSTSMTISARVVSQCAVHMDHHAFKYHKKHKKEHKKKKRIHAECADDMPYQTYDDWEHDKHFDYAEFDEDDDHKSKDDDHFEKHSETKDDDGVRWITAEF